MLLTSHREQGEMSLGHQIRMLRKERKMSQETLAAAADITSVYVSKIENERAAQVSFEVVSKIAKALNVPIDTLLSRPGNLDYTTNIRLTKVPVFSYDTVVHHFSVGGKKGMAVAEPSEVFEHVLVNVHDPRAFALFVSDNSMEEKFPKGSCIVCSPAAKPRSGDFVIALCGRETLFRRLQASGKSRILLPLNPRYRPVIVSRDVKIVGKVVKQIVDL